MIIYIRALNISMRKGMGHITVSSTSASSVNLYFLTIKKILEINL